MASVPKFNAARRKALRDFWAVYEANYDQVWKSIAREAERAGYAASAVEDEGKRSRELRRIALVEGKWAPYLDYLRASGTRYAEANVPFAVWIRLVSAVRDQLSPVLYKAYGKTPERFLAAMSGMADLTEIALSTIGERYVETRQSTIAGQQAKLKESEARLSGIIHSAMDAIITVNADQKVTVFNAAAEKMFACPADGAIGQPLDKFIPERFRHEHRWHVKTFGQTGVTARSMTRPGILWALRSDGKEFPIEATISQLEAGGEKLFTVILRDITERQRTNVRHAATRLLLEAPSLEEAAPRVVQTICENLGWDMGAFWRVIEGEGVARCEALWKRGVEVAPEFEKVTRSTNFGSGTGLPGRVWATGRIAWVRDVSQDPNFPRARIAAKEGLHGAFAFPVFVDGRLFGIFEFFSSAIQEPDDDLVQMMATIGSQTGQLIERKRAEREILNQQEAIRQLSTPVLQLREHLLILPIIGLIDERRARQLTEQLLSSITHHRARVVVLDVTGVAALDEHVANHLIKTIEAARFLGAEVVVTGLSRDLAHTLTTIDVDLRSLRAVGDLQGGIEEAERILNGG